MPQFARVIRWLLVIIVLAALTPPSARLLAALPAATRSALSLPQALSSTVLLVDTTADQPSQQACDAATPDDCSLRGALSKANQATDMSFLINVPAGIYTLTLTGVTEDNNASGDLDVTTPQPLAIIGDPQGQTLIQAGPNGSNAIDRIFDFRENSQVTLELLTIRYGKADYGGGLYNLGQLTLRNSTVFSNTATANGGGIDNFGALTMHDSTVSSNRAVNIGGISNRGAMTMTHSIVSANLADNNNGGITNYARLVIVNSQLLSNTAAGTIGALNNIGELTISDSIVRANHAATTGAINNRGAMTMTQTIVSANKADYNNGGIFNNQRLTILRSHILSNTAANIGGINNFGELTITDSRVSGNDATTTGAIGNRGNLIMIGSTVSENQATNIAGILNETRLTLSNSAVVSNTAQEAGGGIDNRAALTITNSTISGNRANGANAGSSGGGGITQVGNAATLFMAYSTLAHNQATQAARSGLWLQGGAATLHNTILANNGNGAHSVNNLRLEAGASFTSVGYNLSNAWNGAPLHATDLTTDPRLAPLAAHGPTPDQTSFIHDLLPDSPAIDGGGGLACPTTDQRGIPRPRGLACDSGAVEGIPVADLVLQKAGTPAIVLVNEPITYTLAITNVGPRPATTVRLTDTLPANATLLKASTGCQAAGQFVHCALMDLAREEHTQVTMTIQMATPGVIVNHAHLAAAEVDPLLSNNQAQAETQVITRPTTVLVSQPPSVSHRSALTITFTGIDGGAGVAGFECARADEPFAGCSSPQVYSGLTNGSYTFQVRAYDSLGYRDLTPAVVDWTVVLAADLALHQTSRPVMVLSGEPVTYTLTITNHGPSVATNIYLTETLPVSAILLATSAGCQPSPELVICALPDLAANATATITLTAHYTHTGVMTNNAALASVVADPLLTNNQAQAQTQVITRPATLLTGQPLSVTTSNNVTFTFAGLDGGAGIAGFECALDSGVFSRCSSPQRYSNLTVGGHTFQVRTYDHLGYRDLTPVEASWLVTQVHVPPTPTPLPPTPIPPSEITPEEGGVVITEDQALTLTFPAGAVKRGVNITITRMSGPPQSTSAFAFAGKAFSIIAHDLNDQPVTSFSQPFILVLTYADSDWQAAGITDESQLNLYFWDGRSWQALLPCTGCALDTENNRITIRLDHLTEFALLAPITSPVPTPRNSLYVPFVQR